MLAPAIRVVKIDSKDEASLWSRLPEVTSRQNVQFCFRNYIPPAVTVWNPETEKDTTYFFGCLFQRNGIEKESNFLFKVYNIEHDHRPLYAVEAVRERMDSFRLNYGICSFKVAGYPKILLVGGKNYMNCIETAEDANLSLTSTCLLFDVTTERFERDFELQLSCPKDLVTSVCIDNKFIYSFFGRKAK